MSSPRNGSSAARLRALRNARGRRATLEATTARSLMTVAFGVAVTTLMILAIFAAIVLLAAHDGLGSLASVVSGLWLACHQVPVSITEVTIGILPLAPTLLIVAGTARVVRRYSADRANQDLLPILISALGGPLLITAVSLAVLMDAASADPVQSPNALLSFGWTVAVHGAGTALGLVSRWLPMVIRRLHIAPEAVRAIRSGALAFGILLAGASILVVARLVIRFDQAREMLGTGNSVAGYFALVVLSLLYLPNVVIGTASVLVGANAHVGPVTADLFSPHTGQVPPLPILSVLPGGSAVYAPVLFLVAFAAAMWLGRTAQGRSLGGRVQAVFIAAGTGATLMVLSGLLAGGALGVLGTAGVNVPAAGVFAFCWLAAGGTLATVVLGHDHVRVQQISRPEADQRRTAVDEIEEAAQGRPLAADETEFDRVEDGWRDGLAEDDPADEEPNVVAADDAAAPDDTVDTEPVDRQHDSADDRRVADSARETRTVAASLDEDDDFDDADIDLMLRNKH